MNNEFKIPMSGRSILELHEICNRQIIRVTIENTVVNTTVYSDLSGTTFEEQTKIILHFENGTRCEIMQHVPLPTEN